MLLTEPLLSCPCCVFGVIVMLEDPATTHLQCSYWGTEVVGCNLTIHGPIHPPLNTVHSSCPLCRKAPPKHDVSTPMLHGWDGVLGIVLILLPRVASGVYTKKFYFGLIWPHDLLPCPPLDHPDGLWQTSDGPGHVLAWAGGPCARCRILIHDGVVCY